MKKVYILASSSVTGGPEACHQLADALNRDVRRAWIVYTPFDSGQRVPQSFERYDVTPALRQDIRPGSIVVLPETCPQLVDQFPGSEVYFWWLSVDYFSSRGRILKRTVPLRAVRRFRLDKLRRKVDCHLYQSEYAHDFLKSVDLHPCFRLSDYLAAEFIQPFDKSGVTRRENVLVYNPAKGMERTTQILRALERDPRPMPEVVALRGLTRDQIRELFERAKVYIDFGEHPGKDRIPREAVARGACILTNRRGSAANLIDVPVPEYMKIDDDAAGFEKIAADRIHSLMDDFPTETRYFDRYRQLIEGERAEFLRDARSAFRQ